MSLALTIQYIVLGSLVTAFIYLPMLSTVDDDGAVLLLGPTATRLILWFVIVASFVEIPYMCVTAGLGMPIAFGVEYVTGNIIETYIGDVRATMLVDANRGVKQRRLLVHGTTE